MTSAPPEAGSALLTLENKLARVSAALRDGDAPALEAAVLQLQSEVLRLAQRLNAPGRRGRELPADLRHRLVRASAEVAAQREALARASATMNRGVLARLNLTWDCFGAPSRPLSIATERCVGLHP
jgi:hypothetical protein